MYAIIEDSGTQIRVAAGDVLDVDLRDLGRRSKTVRFDRVLLLGDLEPIETVRVLQQRLALTDGQRDSILTHLLQSNDLSRWGLANAVTRASQDLTDYDRATELEQAGGKIVELGDREWRSISACDRAA